MVSTQEHLLIKDIRNDLVILQDGSMAVVLETSAVNFGLLSDNEQYAIISSFAGMLNSLSFAIQIVIRSKRLDISHYLESLRGAQQKQTNPLLYQMIDRYRSFIRETVRENEVLDKQFFIVIPLSYLEVGLGRNAEANFKKALTILIPRRDHIIRQLARCGIRSDQLTTEELVRLFYDVYNGQGTPAAPNKTSPEIPIQPALQPEPRMQPRVHQEVPRTPQQAAPSYQGAPQPAPVRQTSSPQPSSYNQIRTTPIQQSRPGLTQAAGAPSAKNGPSQIRRSPFVVEELPDDYGTV